MASESSQSTIEGSILRILQFLDSLAAVGISRSITSGLLREYSIDDACDAVSHDGDVSEVVATQVLHAVSESFINDSVGRFESECCAGENVDLAFALETLAVEFHQASALLHHCSVRLLAHRPGPAGVPNSTTATEGLCTSFATKVRSTLLEEGLLHNNPTQQSTQRLLCYLRRHGESLLEALEKDHANGCLMLENDKCFAALHKLSLVRGHWIQDGWIDMLYEAVEERLRILDDDDGTQAQVLECLKWKQDVVDPFVRAMVLGTRYVVMTTTTSSAMGGAATTSGTSSELRSEVNRLCSELEQHLMTVFCRKRTASFFDLIVEYPASLPALQDVRYCLLRSGNGRALLSELIAHVKKILADRLHRPGSATEAILTVLVRAIRALCVVLHKNEQSAGVFAVVGDTLKHLRDRKDSVAAVVRDITEQNTDESVLYSDLVTAQQSGPAAAAADDDSDDEVAGDAVAHPGTMPSTGRRPDVLRVLLSTLSAQTIVDEFRSVLAQRIFTKPMHGYDTLDEEEVLERIRCVFGEDLLAACTVMVRDIQASRRLNTRVKERLASVVTGTAQEPSNVVPLSSTIISTACWPNVNGLSQLASEPPLPHSINHAFEPHPALAGYMQQYAAQFQLLKPNQRVVWMTQLGRVTIRLAQKHTSNNTVMQVPHTLGILSASVALSLREGAKTIEALAQELKCEPSLIQHRVAQHHPVVFVFRAATGKVSLQPLIVTSSTFQFDDDNVATGGAAGGGTNGPEDDAGVPSQELGMIQNTITAMLKARAASKTAAEIHNSLKMFLKYAGSLQDLKRVLQYLVGQGKLATLDGSTYSLPK
ncbi:Hypothetical protein, putative [Bodo saltans]|uniref:Anaphase-promoting complex subunit 2 n=1 Tax=Bodo saltans TaxID=75058 RepID=A0A0S4J0P6_BODSA|nr:Hypothetical protein, putative [Bodo saltans]|eukprot:CUG38259.1 Hypothetical protein, putative [Bodo saltans]